MADPTALYGGYVRASRYSRIRDADLNRALKPYKITLKRLRTTARGENRSGLGGANDAALRSVATQSVVGRYRRAHPKVKTTTPTTRSKR